MGKIIHISGTSGSGKTTLGEELKKLHKNKIVVVDTDIFIQHGTPEAKRLIKLDKNPKEYKREWKKIMQNKIDMYVNRADNKPIIFTGLLNNWGIDDEPYKFHLPCAKYFLDVSLAEILKRYYLRIYLTEQKVSKKQSIWFWDCLAKGDCNIRSSKEVIKNYKYDVAWHKKNGYKILNGEKIKGAILVR